MKRLAGIFAAVLMVLSSWGFSGSNAAQASEIGVFSVQSPSVLAAVSDRRNAADAKLGEISGKLDLNNSDVRDFRVLRGFYPSLASKIIKNAPYSNVDDVLDIADLSEKQKTRLESNLDKFVVTDVSSVMNAGDDRYNPGVY